MTKKTFAYSYLRISSDIQRQGGGIKRQMEASAKWAEEHGYQLKETISDEGVSAYRGTHAKKGAFASFLAAIESGDVERGSILIVESLDRLSRENPFSAFNQFGAILNNGVSIVTLLDGQVYSAETMTENMNQIFVSLSMMIRAHDESKTKSQRIGAAWKQKRAAIGNKIFTKNVPCWLEINENEEIVAKEDAAKTIRQMFDWCNEGMGIYSITRKLNEGYAPISSATKWNDSFVAKILKNRQMIGEFQPHQKVEGKPVPIGDPIKDYFPKIVDVETFTLAQAKMTERSNGKGAGRKGETVSNLFSGLVQCGNCGGSVVMKNKGKPPKGFKYLRCTNSLMGSKCKCPAWRYDDFENMFLKFVKDVSFESAIEVDGDKVEMETLFRRKETNIAKQGELKSAFDKLLENFEADLPEMLRNSLVERSRQIESDLNSLSEEQAEIEANIADIQSRDATGDRAEFIQSYASISDGADIRDVRMKMQAIVKRHVGSISTHNGAYFEPWEEIPGSLRKELEKKGINEQREIEAYFSKPHGRRLYDKHDRYILVHFKNGALRRVGYEYTVLETSVADIEMVKRFQAHA